MDRFFPALMVSLFLVFESCVTAPSFAHFRADGWALMVVEASSCRGEAPIDGHRMLVAALTPIGGGAVFKFHSQFDDDALAKLTPHAESA